MRFPTRSILFLACWAQALATPAVIDDGGLGQESSLRDPKLLFQFITIAPEVCRSTSGAQAGICYSAADCTTLGGRADGTCAKGLGVCCLITKTCGGTSPFRETTFVNPNNPAAETAALGGCQLRITPLNDNICQLRLDFENFRLSQPDNEGVCDRDFLQIPGVPGIPSICGDNTGQHLYVDVSPQFGSALINVDTASAGSRWNIKVTQIECNSAARAPAGCLQYFNTTQGTISSFNFDPNSINTPGTRQLANQAYGICIGAQPGYCSVTYRQTADRFFSLGDDPQALAPGLVVPGFAGDTDCTTDYLLIPGAVIAAPTTVDPNRDSADRFCGVFFPTVTTSVTPFNLFFVTDDGEVAVPDNNNQGFRIMYRMNAC